MSRARRCPRGSSSNSWLFPYPSAHTSPSHSYAEQRDVPSQTLQEVLVAPWVRVDQVSLDHHGAPVGQGSQVSQGCPGGQRCSII